MSSAQCSAVRVAHLVALGGHVRQALQDFEGAEHSVWNWDADAFVSTTLHHLSQVGSVHELHGDVVGVIHLSQVHDLTMLV